VAPLSAVPASIPVLARLRAVAEAMVETLAIEALENNPVLHVVLDGLSLAVGTDVAFLCSAVSLDAPRRWAEWEE